MVACAGCSWHWVSADHYRVGGALAYMTQLMFNGVNYVSADHYRVGGALPRVLVPNLVLSFPCQPIITASGGRSGWDTMATATTKNRCQPIITASGGRSALSGRCMIQPKVSADHYRVGGALAIIVS